MQGLLDIWGDYWKRKEPQEDSTFGSSTDFSKRQVNRFNRSNLSTAGGVDNSGASADMDQRIPRKRGEIPTPPKYIRQKKEVRDRLGRVVEQGSPINSPNTVGHPMRNKTLPVIPGQDASKTPFHPSQGGDLKYHGGDQKDQLKWWQQLAGKMNIDFDKAAASWKEKGGFEGLMANPAFTMGLAFMQAGAEGKSLGEGALDNVMKAGGISSHYKKILKSREEAPIEVTATDVGEVKSLLQTMNISAPSNAEKIWGFLKGKKNMQFKWDLASEEIAVELQKEIKKLKKNKKPGAPEVVYDTPKKLQILKRMFDEGRFKKEGGTWFTDSTLQTTYEIPKFDNRAEGGPVNAGQPYIVGEKGPEIVIPHSDGNVLTNDDSQIFSMLLASNPQLQNVSKQRAERILRSRFPEYFEG